MDEATTYDVRVYKTEVYRGAKVTTHRVRWKVAREAWRTSFRNAAHPASPHPLPLGHPAHNQAAQVTPIARRSKLSSPS
jgi:hypothetical protein